MLSGVERAPRTRPCLFLFRSLDGNWLRKRSPWPQTGNRADSGPKPLQNPVRRTHPQRDSAPGSEPAEQQFAFWSGARDLSRFISRYSERFRAVSHVSRFRRLKRTEVRAPKCELLAAEGCRANGSVQPETTANSEKNIAASTSGGPHLSERRKRGSRAFGGQEDFF